MTNYDSFSHCHFTDIFFAIHAGAKELKLGFTSIEVNGKVRPQCVLCLTVLAHSSLKETKLRLHPESNHGNFVNKSLEVFKEKEHQVKRSRIDRLTAWGGITYSHSHAVRASFAVAWKIACAKAPHTAGENLIKQASVEMARIMCGDAVANKMSFDKRNGSFVK